MNGTPVLLASELASWLPWVVGEREHDGLSTCSSGNTLDRGSLLGFTWAGSSVTATLRWPSGLQVDTGLAWAETINNLELGGDEGTSVGGGNARVEEGVDVATNDIDGSAKSAGVSLPGVERLGGGAWSGVSSGGELGLALRDETSKSGSTAVTVENGLVTDDDQVDHAELSPADDVSDLLLSTGNTSLANEDTNDHSQASGLAGRSDVDETRAVSAVDTDSLEARGGDESDINHDVRSALASAGAGVW